MKKRNTPIRKPLAERFWAKVIKHDGDKCWEWTGATNEKGYGIIGKGRRGEGNMKASRVSYLLHHGELPSDRAVCHTCDNPPCTNPNHLYLGTLLENNDDKKAKGRQARGAVVGSAKLTAEQVAEIRRRYQPRIVSQYALAREFGVSRSAIGFIVNGQRWVSNAT